MIKRIKERANKTRQWHIDRMENIKNKQFNRLFALRFDDLEEPGSGLHWWFLCDCGAIISLSHRAVVLGGHKSCGCLRRDQARIANKLAAIALTTHGMGGIKNGHRDPFYGVWASMLQRCKTPSHTSYKYYGARGIKVSEEWHDFMSFYKDMHSQYVRHLEKHFKPEFLHQNTTIERIDNNGDYCKENCKWATFEEQGKNKRPHNIKKQVI